MSVAVLNASIFEDTQIAFSHLSNFELRKAYYLYQSFNNPLLLKAGMSLASLAFRLHLPVEFIIKATAYRQFCGGETLKECAETIGRLAASGILTALQYSVETKAGEADYNKTARELVNAVDFASKNRHVKVICSKLTGLGSFELFEKLHANGSPDHEDTKALERIRERMDLVCSFASKAGVELFFDAEESWIQRPIDMLIDEMMLRYNKERAIVYNAFQLYRTDRLDFLKASYEKTKANNVVLGAKLVRGAYMEKERQRAKRKGYPSPIYPDKAATDKAYNEALDFCVKNIDGISCCAATHNEESCLHLMNLLDTKGIRRNHPHIFFSQLYGMGEHLTYHLAREGFTATKLVPYGPVREAIPYLIRRAEENSAITGQAGRELQMIEKEMKRRGLI
ncbi:MAG TPA: proline dehydrogenase family protein [Chitinophagales bacterium]|nr:proline dehydrogenase family protein [Chitinophagales bacterium]